MTSDIGGPPIPDTAEATDGDELGEEVGDETRPGTVGFPPTTPAGVGGPDSLADADHRDSLAERRQREEPDRPATPPHDTVRLVDPYPSGETDVEAEAVAEEVPPVELASPEEAAMHLESDRDDHRPMS